MKAYSVDLRRKIAQAVGRGMTKAEAARVFGVGITSVKRYCRMAQAGGFEPKPRPGKRPSIRADQHPQLWEQLREHDTATLREHSALWRERTGVAVSIWAMSRAIRKLGWSRKKGRWVPASGMSGPEPSGGSE